MAAGTVGGVRLPDVDERRSGRATAAAILGALADAVIATDGDGRVCYMNPAAERASGWSQAQVAGGHIARLLLADPARASGGAPAVGAGHSQAYQMLRRNGAPTTVEVREGALLDERGGQMGRVYVCRDVGAALALSQAMAYGALHDALTGLANRRRLLERLHGALTAAGRTSRPVGVCFLDVDGMKGVNDTMGHAAGDRLLRSIASRLVRCVRASDTVARLGGDEFVVVLPQMKSIGDAAAVTGTLTRRLARPHRVGRQSLRVTASMGWAFYPRDGRHPQALLKAADQAMYAAKHACGDEPNGR